MPGKDEALSSCLSTAKRKKQKKVPVLKNLEMMTINGLADHKLTRKVKK